VLVLEEQVAQQVVQDQLEQLALLDPQEQLEAPEVKDLLDLMVPLVCQVIREYQVRLD